MKTLQSVCLFMQWRRITFADMSTGSLQEAVLEILKEAGGKPLNHKQITRRLPLELADDAINIQQLLEDLHRSGTIRQLERGRYYVQAERQILSGKLEITRSGDGWVVLEEGDDVYIPAERLGRALHRDLVRVKVRGKRGNSSPTGEVIEVLERHRGPYAGIIRIQGQRMLLESRDKHLHYAIGLSDKPDKRLRGLKAVVEITGWEPGDKFPQGRLMHILGEPGENETEMHAIVAEFGFPLSFLPATEAHSEKISESIPAGEAARRRDFRDILTFTIDPVDAKDFDDAISYRRIDADRVEIGVHIADVAHYIEDGDPIDLEAAQRATSVYLVDRTIPMLPEKLSNNLCSLRPNEDRLAFAAVFELDNEAKIVSRWFGRSIIHSRRRFTYEEAQEVLETGQGDHNEALLYVNTLAKILNKRRMEEGSVNFESTEVRFKLDADGKPLGMVVKERKDAHKLIEEFMLLANREVAALIHRKNMESGRHPFVYRVHDEPQGEKPMDLMLMCKKFGHSLQADNEKVLKRSLNTLMDRIKGKPEEPLLQNMAIRSMAKAVYTGQKTSHFGLGFSHYTHFTSPIRRYPDLLVHRLLGYYLNDREKEAGYSSARIEQLAKHSSNMEQQAAEAERASVRYKMAEYLEGQVGQVFDGIITGLTDWGIYVELTDNKCEGMVRLQSLRNDRYSFSEKDYAIIGARTKQRYVYGQPVRVRVKGADKEKRQIDFYLIES